MELKEFAEDPERELEVIYVGRCELWTVSEIIIIGSFWTFSINFSKVKLFSLRIGNYNHKLPVLICLFIYSLINTFTHPSNLSI